ncbi:hypothetical protein [Amaricoccus solimangrovi]|nr:hypothetical protein [Amaricoccus solimangrovi]
MSGGSWINQAGVRRREQRGDVVAAGAEDLLGILELGADLIPGAG